uniref:Uncharacterized protein n=1 Tax=Leersia perrieri TaxID=77586 RepID=A0A0D9WIE4_9ORYZ
MTRERGAGAQVQRRSRGGTAVGAARGDGRRAASAGGGGGTAEAASRRLRSEALTSEQQPSTQHSPLPGWPSTRAASSRGTGEQASWYAFFNNI